MKLVLFILSLFLLTACGNTSEQTSHQAPPLAAPSFSADSAYHYIQTQVDFGARVPGSDAHRTCAAYLASSLQRFGAEVELESGMMINYANRQQPVMNIIGHYGDSTEQRLLLCAHWDTRPWADQEANYDERRAPILGADDGASGVGVLLEVARQLHLLQAKGETVPAVDIIFFDCEDMGTPDFYLGQQREDTWCLGSQFWAQNYLKKKQNGIALNYKYGILLDMVGAVGASFPKEYFSVQFAKQYADMIWTAASKLGYGKFFRNDLCYPITDDHYYINTLASIPCVDIIHYEQGSQSGFPHFWHTQQDNMTNIDHSTLDAVGKTIMQVIITN